MLFQSHVLRPGDLCEPYTILLLRIILCEMEAHVQLDCSPAAGRGFWPLMDVADRLDHGAVFVATEHTHVSRPPGL